MIYYVWILQGLGDFGLVFGCGVWLFVSVGLGGWVLCLGLVGTVFEFVCFDWLFMLVLDFFLLFIWLFCFLGCLLLFMFVLGFDLLFRVWGLGDFVLIVVVWGGFGFAGLCFGWMFGVWVFILLLVVYLL